MDLKLAIIIPDRGDRPRFFDNCLRMLKAQTFQSFHLEIINHPPKDNDVDITPRYKRGYNNLKGKGFDLISFIESDDWYSPIYLETMIAKWESLGRPDLFGTARTMYYHIELKAYYIMEHHTRSSAMNTFIKPDMDFEWPVDLEPYLDLHLWKTIPNRMIFMPDQWLSVGIKHGVGRTIEGGGHRIHDDDYVKLRYIHPDNGFLKQTLDPESFEFYDNYFKK